MPSMSISDRKKRILTAIVEGYIATAEPVGSKALADIIGCSSATIRNEMAELSALGYLEQTHTSSGRVPTAKGYRLYVNELMERQKLSAEETEAIARRLGDKERQLDKLLDEAGALTSALTQYPAYAVTVQEAVTARRFDFIYIDPNTFIIVLLLSDNSVKNKLVHLPFSMQQEMMQKLATLFNASFTGISEEEITDELIAATERAANDGYGLVAVAASFLIESLTTGRAGQVKIKGTSHLLAQPEYRDPDKAHELMRFISDGDSLLRDLPAMPEADNGLRVTIGPENLAEELKDSSVVMASYNAGGGMRGYIGVVGPTRMDYSSVAARLSCIADGLSRMLAAGDVPSGLNNKLVLKETDKHEQ